MLDNNNINNNKRGVKDLCFFLFVCVGLKQAIKFGSTIFGARPPFKPKN